MKTVEEFFKGYGTTQILLDDLRTNLDELAPQLSEKEKATLMRVNLIVIRKCLEDFGAK